MLDKSRMTLCNIQVFHLFPPRTWSVEMGMGTDGEVLVMSQDPLCSWVREQVGYRCLFQGSSHGHLAPFYQTSLTFV